MKRPCNVFLFLLSLVFLLTSGCGASKDASENSTKDIAEDHVTETIPEKGSSSIPEEASLLFPEEIPQESETLSDITKTVEPEVPENSEEATEEAAVSEESSSEEGDLNAELKAKIEIRQNSQVEEQVDGITGIFEGLEDNHTVIFSFDGAETAFYFEDPSVQKTLSEAVIGSSYTFSYRYDFSLGLNTIFEITEN